MCVHTKEHPEKGLAAFEVVIDAKIFRVESKALQRWIVKRRDEWKGPKGMFFNQRPILDS